MTLIHCGFDGKLPSRGDFVGHGLPRTFLAPWQSWVDAALSASQQAIGDDWVEKWREAPIWRFSLPGGACGPDAVLGLLIPSVDRAGRYYPLTIAAVFVGRLPAASDHAWLEAAEECGLDALVHLQDPETLIHSLGVLPCPREENREAPAWWTTGSRLVAPTHLPLPGLPPTADFAAMLDSAY